MLSVDVSLQVDGKLRDRLDSLELDTLIDVNLLVEQVATAMLSRVRRRFRKQENPDGSRWPVSRAAMIRAAGGYTYAKGGDYARGGKKTGGHTLFASGNLYHSIQLARRGRGEYAIQSDVPYAKFYMREPRIIIGTRKAEVDELLKLALEKQR